VVLPAKQDLLARAVLAATWVLKVILEILVQMGFPVKRGLAATLATLVLKEQLVQLELKAQLAQRATPEILVLMEQPALLVPRV
jgi:hypothetical protein